MTRAELDIREMRAAEIDAMLAFRNSLFTPMDRPQWEAMNGTAVMAFRGSEIWGAIPLQYRELKINARVSVPVVFENAVGVREDARSKGIGTAMLQAAAEFIADRADALCVIRGGERSDGYRFYRKTHHGDLYYEARLLLEAPVPQEPPAQVETLPWTCAVELEPDLLRLFEADYGACGGLWRRRPGYFEQVVRSHVYRNENCRLVLARDRGTPTAYAIVNPNSMLWEGHVIYDLAAASPEALRRVLDTVAAQAARQQTCVTVPGNREQPLQGALVRYGFHNGEPGPYYMARILRPDRIFAQLAGDSKLRHELYLEMKTPHRDLIVNCPKRPRHRATLWLKESMLSRLMLARLDLASALRMNLVRCSPLPVRVERALCRLFRFCPWVGCGMDYI